jgi:hypothetical protein
METGGVDRSPYPLIDHRVLHEQAALNSTGSTQNTNRKEVDR